MRSAYIIVACLFIFACENSDPQLDARDYPRIQTFAPTVTAGSVQISGALLVPGKNPVTDHGFIWDKSAPNFSSSPKQSLGPLSTVGTFEATITYNFEKGRQYTIQAYAITADYKVLGEQFTFVAP